MTAMRRLEALDERVLLARRHCRRRVHRRLQIADRTIGLAQRQIFGGRPRRDALDQLFDALHLLLQRPLGRRPLLVFALADAGFGLGESGRDRFVETVGLTRERLPFGHDRAPLRLAIVGRLAGCAVVGRGQPVGFERQLAEPGVDALERLAILVALGRAPAGLVEARPELGVLALLRGGARHAFPLGPRPFELVGRVFSAQRFHALADGDECRAPRRRALGLGQPLRLFAPPRLDRGARPRPAWR